MHEYYYSPVSDYVNSTLMILAAITATSAALIYLVRAWHPRKFASAPVRANMPLGPSVPRWRVFAVGVIGFGLLVVIQSCFSITEYKRYSDALDHGRCETISGVVHVLNRESHYGHNAKEKIQIGETTLSFSYFSITPGYHDTVAYTGLLGEGVCVDMCVFDQRILRFHTLPDCSR